jgi:hypothetical protein
VQEVENMARTISLFVDDKLSLSANVENLQDVPARKRLLHLACYTLTICPQS